MVSWKPIGMVYEYDPVTDKRTKSDRSGFRHCH
jgi:hypothetical protein